MLRPALAAVAALLLTAGAANATVFTGTDTFSDSTSGNALNLTATYDLDPISFSLNQGQTFSTLDLLTIKSTDSSGGSFFGSTATDNIAVNFDFTAPSTGTGSTSGSGSETVFSLFGTILGSTGAITWNNPSTIAFSDGALLDVSLGDTLLSGTGTTKSGVVAASFTLASNPTPVPEPSTLALFGTALLGLGMVWRKRRAN